jgi:hypothetical protein
MELFKYLDRWWSRTARRSRRRSRRPSRSATSSGCSGCCCTRTRWAGSRNRLGSSSRPTESQVPEVNIIVVFVVVNVAVVNIVVNVVAIILGVNVVIVVILEVKDT